MPAQDQGYRTLSRALRQVLARPQLAMELKSPDTQAQAMQMLGIDDAIRQEILNILMVLEDKSATTEPTPDLPTKPQEIETDREFLFESFGQLRMAYRTSIAMSVIIFVVGVAFLFTAAIRAFTHPESVLVTSVIGGIGIVQIVALFYRNPLADVARTVSNTQQAKMAVLSYLLSISLLNEQIKADSSSDTHIKTLTHLTERAIKQLQEFTESDPTESASN